MNTALEIGIFEARQPTGAQSGCGNAIPKLSDKRRQREHKTMVAMVRRYCRDHHAAAEGLCPECQAFLEYATVRLERCRFGANKPTCANCPIHCYQAKRREEVKTIMRYAGPRMLWEHPILAIRHLLDGYKKAPELAPAHATRNEPG